MISRTRLLLFLPLVLCAIIVSSCGLLPIQATSSGNGEWLDWDGKEGWSGPAASGESMLGMKSSSDASEELPLAAPAEEGAELSEAESEVRNQNASLRAGSVDDNASWDDYLLYRLQFSDWGIEVHEVDVTERHTIQVVNTRGMPVLGAEIEILDDRGRRHIYAFSRRRYSSLLSTGIRSWKRSELYDTCEQRRSDGRTPPEP